MKSGLASKWTLAQFQWGLIRSEIKTRRQHSVAQKARRCHHQVGGQCSVLGPQRAGHGWWGACLCLTDAFCSESTSVLKWVKRVVNSLVRRFVECGLAQSRPHTVTIAEAASWDFHSCAARKSSWDVCTCTACQSVALAATRIPLDAERCSWKRQAAFFSD